MKTETAWRLGVMPIFLILAALLAVGLRLYQSTAPLTYDEYASLYFSDRSFRDLGGWWMVRETNPPLFYSLLKLWRFVTPENQAALRVLPLILSLTQIGLLCRFAADRYGSLAAILCLLLFALSPSDIFQSEYLRGYVLAKLGITISFIGVFNALETLGRSRTWWICYVGGAVIAIYSHTTMLTWPLIVTVAILIDAIIARKLGRLPFAHLILANIVILLISSWDLALAMVQLGTRAQNIAWIEPLSWSDYGSSLKLQLLLDASWSSAIMALLIAAGLLRTRRDRATRLSAIILILTVIAFRATNSIHAVVSDYTLHWCACFSVLLAGTALAKPTASGWFDSSRKSVTAATAVFVTVAVVGILELRYEVWIPEPQDWRYTIRTVARDEHASLLVAHESVGLVVTEACMLEFHVEHCPFPLVVMSNPAPTDSWSFGGYPGRQISAREVRGALGTSKSVYAFSRYVYTPLEPLGLDPGDYRETQWDDGELIGPIPIEDFDPHS